ncbi:MAG: TonB-dependent receptor, partial [Pseudomonadota bacterium]
GPAVGGANNLWDVEQVEVLLGPQATTQGRNALAGAVVQWTADPQYEFGAKLRVLAGSDETFQGSAMVTGPILDGQVAYRLSYDHREEDFDGFNVVTQRPFAYNDANTSRGKLLIEPNAVPNLRVELNISHIDEFTTPTGRASLPPVDSPERETFDPYEFIDYDFRGFELQNQSTYYIADITYEINENWRIASVTTYEETENDTQSFGSFAGLRESTAATTAADFRLHFDYQRVDGWIGAYYFTEDISDSSTNFLDLTTLPFSFEPPGSILSRNSENTVDIENAAIYGDLTYQLTDRFSIGVGARYDIEERFDTGQQGSVSVNNESCVINLGGRLVPCVSLFPITSDPALDVDYEAFLPRANLSYALNESSSVSFMVARGYRAGGVQTVGDANEEFDPEFLTNYEVVYRSLWMDDKLMFNVNVFFSDWTDQQLAIPDGLNFRTVNIGESEMLGAEFYTSYQFDRGVNVYGTLGLLDTEITNAPFAIDEAGNPLPGEPGFANLAG